MAKTKISEFSATAASNTDIDSINIAEGCAPSGINDAIRELMSQLKDFQTGAVGDSFNGPVGTTTAAAGAFTTLSASSTATLSGLTASTALALDASKNVVSVTNTGTGSNVLATSPTLVTPILGTPTSATLTNATGLPIATGVSGLGTGVATALAVNVGSSGAPLVNGGVLGTPSSGTATNLTGLPISTGVSGLGTGVATFLATPSSANLAAALTDETGSGANVFATSPTLVTPILGTPTSATLTNATGLPLSTGVTGTLPVANGGTGLTTTPANGALDIGNGTGFTRGTLTAGTNITITNSAGGISIAAAGGTSQWTTSGTQIYYNTGAVGIGTASPDTYTDGGKNLTILSSTASTRANLALVGNQTAVNEILGRINITNSNSSNTAYRVALIDGVRGSDNNSGYLTFSTGYTTNPSERVRITENGRTLFGTTTENTSGGVVQVSNGITFPATQSASSDANTLDDYEEGTWTPTYSPNTGSFGSITYGRQKGFYQKIGNTVYLQMYIYLSGFSIGTATNGVRVDGLPFTPISASEYQAGAVAYTYQWSTNSPTKCALYQSDPKIYLFRDAQGATDSSPEILASNLSAGNPAAILCLTINYRVA
jgi:hypothetical protein